MDNKDLNMELDSNELEQASGGRYELSEEKKRAWRQLGIRKEREWGDYQNRKTEADNSGNGGANATDGSDGASGDGL